jgi:hypothetical protein
MKCQAWFSREEREKKKKRKKEKVVGVKPNVL